MKTHLIMIYSVGLGGGQKENLYGRENFELSGKRFGRRITRVMKYWVEVRKLFMNEWMQGSE